MKKLIVMLAAGVLAVSANAATVNWTAAKGYLYDGAKEPEKITSGTAYLMLSAYSASGLVSAFVQGGYNATAMASTLKSSDQYLGSGAIGGNARIGEGTGTTTATDAISAYFVVFGDQGVYISPTATSEYDGLAQSHSLGFASITSSSKAFNDLTTGGYSAPGWYGTSDVPEPTSGLLMLIGLAGLALRRKRA